MGNIYRNPTESKNAFQPAEHISTSEKLDEVHEEITEMMTDARCTFPFSRFMVMFFIMASICFWEFLRFTLDK
jgi:hypothetical protein